MVSTAANGNQSSFWTGFAVGWPVAASLVFALAVYYLPQSYVSKAFGLSWERTKKRQKPKATRGRRIQPLSYHGRDGRSSQIETLEKYVPRIGFEYLRQATDSFSENNVIEIGRQGTVYKATLMNGNSLAIKRFRQDSHHLDHHFMIEIMAIGRVRHRNIVTLLGFCIEREERLLVYSYMPNGSLYKWLHPMHSHSSALDWPLRLHIAKEIAKGLAWLHHHGQYGVTHGRISSKCILLDKHFNPKISNFGRATLVKSYYYKYMMSSHKKDIYGLGLLLLEMVTGKNPDELQKMSESFNGNLVEWITLFLNTGNFYEIVDKSLIGQGFDVQIIQLLKVASWCIRPALKERATILQVTSNLSIIGVGNGSAYHLNVEEDVDGEIEIVEVGF